MSIVVEHLWHTYHKGTPLEQSALEDVSLEIPDRSIVAIVGITGSGKSTLVQHFNGLLRPLRGHVLVDGREIGQWMKDPWALRRHVGMLFQFPEAQLFAATVFDDVAFGPRQLGLDADTVTLRVRAALEIVGMPLEAFGPRSPFALSGGQMRRVALAGVLAMEPRVLVLDEPTAGLDGDARADLYDRVRAIRATRGVTTVLVSHNMREVALLADTIFVLAQGRVVATGTPRDLFARPADLDRWGLAAPDLNQMLAHLRALDAPVDVGALTVREALCGLERAADVLSSRGRLRRQWSEEH